MVHEAAASPRRSAVSCKVAAISREKRVARELRIREAVRAGVSAYVVDGLDAARVKTIVEVAVAQFEDFQNLRTQLAQANLKLSERKLIERAKGMLMKARRLDEEAAYALLRKFAM